ncbi:ATP-binding protein [Desulforamulus aquiferis]|uniref:ATP-binding protein n=1 Tax=Desulforamulus aquiferis TaxID=1397668 RepID=A0AAW7ZDT3_9FIRM|nr:ATP-binding protein [Desulforamulus aquiferis]MDO7787892.1 ATP-binding protein [Desulforamulus aquiferis]
MEPLAKAIKLPPSTGANSSGREAENFKCANCQDRGIVPVSNNLAEICPCQQQRKMERLMESSQITPAFRSKTFENFSINQRPPVIQDMFECARDYANRFEEIQLTENNWLVYLGEVGCGKTHLSMAVANSLLAKTIPVLYFPHVEGIKELLKYFQQKSETGIHTRVEKMKKAQVLIWDDLFKGRDKPTDWVMELVFEVINYRYLNLLPTVINSERLDYMLLELDKATGSRILERGKGYTVIVEGQACNYRLQ